jgi:hypothetical protein
MINLLSALRLAQRKEYRAKRRAELIDKRKKQILEFEKMTDAEKTKKLIEIRNMVRKQYLRIQEVRARTQALTQEEALAILKRDHGYKPEEEENLLRNMEHKPASEDEKKEFRKKYKMGEFQVPGELSGFELFLKEKGKDRLVGFIDRLMSDEPPKLPPPADLSVVQKGMQKEVQKEEEGDKKEKPEKITAAPAAPAPAGAKGAAKPAGAKDAAKPVGAKDAAKPAGDKAAAKPAGGDNKKK